MTFLPEPDNPGELLVPTPPVEPTVEEPAYVNIGDESNDIFTVGRSPWWTGDPVYDRELLFPPHEEVEVPSLQRSMMLTTTEAPVQLASGMPDTSVCGYCGTEYVLTEGHSCVAGVPAGTTVKVTDEEYVLVLETNTEHVIYYRIPKESVEIREIPATAEFFQ